MSSERVLRGQTVVVENGIITAIGDVESQPVPEDATVVDGTDRYLMPGFAEMHAHVPGADGEALDRTLTLFAANGVTLVRGMLGRPSHLALRQQLLDNEVFGPRLITSGPSMNGNSVSGPDDGARKVRAQHAAGYDFIKIHPGLAAEEYLAIANTANELGIPFAGHVPASITLQVALDAGMATIDHLDGYIAALMPADSDASGGYGGFFDVLLVEQLIEERIADVARRTAESQTWNVATETLIEHRVSDTGVVEMSNWPEMQYMPRATVRQWAAAKERQLAERGFSIEVGGRAIEVRRRLILGLHEAGAGLLLGSDAPQVFNVPGFSLHRELAIMVDAGLTPFEALATGTTAVAEFFGSNGGIVAVGRDADLVLLDADPLLDINNTRRIHGVMLRGTWYSRSSLDERLEALRSQAH
ncbi:MAG: amidohydrolase family protein [Woeseiaceae bacterium]|nr:amidohydrolase family protein [Woeseiaceae bacterium]